MTKRLTMPGITMRVALAGFAIFAAGQTHAAIGDIYNLGTLGGSSSAGYDINDVGQVVGSAQDAAGRSRAFLWQSNGGIMDLQTTDGYTEARAHAINSSGSVVGTEYDTATGVSHAFAWSPNAPNSITGTMISLARNTYSTARDVNSAGHVVGSSTYAYFVDDGSCTPDHPYYPNCGPGGTWYYEPSAVVWENGIGTDLTSSGVTLETANAINDAGQLTGQSSINGDTGGYAFRYDGAQGSGGVIYDLGTLGGSTSVGRSINDAGQVVGDSWTTGDIGQHAFRYIGTPGSGGMMVDLGTLGGTSSHAFDINDAGFVVGAADRAGVGSSATLWQNDGSNTAVDLDAWLDATNPTLGAYWTLIEARGINNNGLITGVGNYDDGPGGLDDGYRGFVLDAASLASAVPGDFTNDGAVDAADYVFWRKNPAGDLIPADYNIWRTNFGAPFGATVSAAGHSTVPEPNALWLWALASTLLVANRNDRSRHAMWQALIEIAKAKASTDD